MTTSLTWGPLSGMVAPARSTARSASAQLLARLVEDTRMHLLTSYVVRRRVELALGELEEARKEASRLGWNGYGGKPLDLEAYLNAKIFLESLPTTAPSPEVSADPDGEVALDWSFGPNRALTVSIGPTGRCTFAWMLGNRTCRGTDWLDDGIPGSIAHALAQLAYESV